MRTDEKGVYDMNKETYERVSLEITEFDNEDVIATSGVINTTPDIPQDPFEGHAYI